MNEDKKQEEAKEREEDEEEEEEEKEVFILPASLPRGMVPVEVKSSDVYWPGGGSNPAGGERRRLFTNLQFQCYTGMEKRTEKER